MMTLEWRNEAQTILAKVDGPHTVIIEPGHDEWDELSARDDIAPYVAPIIPEPIPDPKLIGVEFEGVMCSATAADQAGLAAVLLAIQLQGAAFQPTRFEFDNGTTLIITLQNWQAFAAVWLPFRQSFFAVGV